MTAVDLDPNIRIHLRQQCSSFISARCASCEVIRRINDLLTEKYHEFWCAIHNKVPPVEK